MLAPPGIWYRAAIMTTARPRLAFSASLALAMVLAAAAIAAWKLGLLPPSVTDRLPGAGQETPAEAP